MSEATPEKISEKMPEKMSKEISEIGTGEAALAETPSAGTSSTQTASESSDAATADGEVAVETQVVVEPKIDALGRAYATGKRKNAIARVWIKPGRGVITVNGREETVYFARPVLRMILRQPLIAAARDGQFDVVATVSGGGLSGQAGAVRHGLSKALLYYEPGLRPVLKRNGFLTRDSRVVERKKYGRAKARRSFQFSKR